MEEQNLGDAICGHRTKRQRGEETRHGICALDVYAYHTLPPFFPPFVLLPVSLILTDVGAPAK